MVFNSHIKLYLVTWLADKKLSTWLSHKITIHTAHSAEGVAVTDRSRALVEERRSRLAHEQMTVSYLTYAPKKIVLWRQWKSWRVTSTRRSCRCTLHNVVVLGRSAAAGGAMYVPLLHLQSGGASHSEKRPARTPTFRFPHLSRLTPRAVTPGQAALFWEAVRFKNRSY